VAARDEAAGELVRPRPAHTGARHEVLMQVEDPHLSGRNSSVGGPAP
jgi:hypothetical protein